MGMLAVTPMPGKPDFSQAADFVQERYDYGQAFPKSFLKKDDLVEALIKGEFYNGPSSKIYKNEDYPYDTNMPQFNGVITLKDGTLFMWDIPRKGIIEIIDSNYRTGYIFYPKEMLDLSSE